MLQVGIDIQLTQLVRNPQMLFWSFFGAGWLLVVPAAMAIRHRSLEETGVTVRPLPRLVIAALICMGVTAVTLDSTRVFGLLSWPVLVTLLVLAIRRGAAPSLTWLASAAFLLSLMLPRTVVWDGHVHGGTAAYSLVWMLEKSGAAPGILPESVLAPFRESPENRIKFSALLPDGGPAPLVGRGAPLFFTMAAGGGAALREGWSRPEPWGTWSESPVAKLRLNLSAEAAAAGALDAQVAAFVGTSGMPQQVEVTRVADDRQP
ncbi:hypothetical protein JL101_012335 [Skermanella rosea]|uniref:hypothetical protein n=1 Tax=Skermanella rosea TaxID=1817965 RepID=UPI00193223FE|nr:hypothetical protein [Skermanella rosea]UEM06181.1 hypothetical protein JL101_012335 [Skermanella rosea]